jgi:hypothetical protein
MTVYCANHKNIEQLAGKFFSHCKLVRSTKEAISPETARQLWEVSEKWFKGLNSSSIEAPSVTESTAACT